MGDVTINTGNTIFVSKGTGTNICQDEYTCTVYLRAKFSRWGTLSGYDLSEVTTAISNVNSYTSASMLVDGKDMDVTFSYPSNNKQTIGKYEWGDRKTLGNSAKGEYVSITGNMANGTPITYIFKLDNAININNPH